MRQSHPTYLLKQNDLLLQTGNFCLRLDCRYCRRPRLVAELVQHGLLFAELLLHLAQLQDGKDVIHASGTRHKT